jgi:hypothetical protein
VPVVFRQSKNRGLFIRASLHKHAIPCINIQRAGVKPANKFC